MPNLPLGLQLLERGRSHSLDQILESCFLLTDQDRHHAEKLSLRPEHTQLLRTVQGTIRAAWSQGSCKSQFIREVQWENKVPVCRLQQTRPRERGWPWHRVHQTQPPPAQRHRGCSRGGWHGMEREGLHPAQACVWGPPEPHLAPQEGRTQSRASVDALTHFLGLILGVSCSRLRNTTTPLRQQRQSLVRFRRSGQFAKWSGTG